MKAFIAMCILSKLSSIISIWIWSVRLSVSLPMSMGLNCYQCTVTNCGDPFDKSASGVAQTGENSTNTYCVVRVLYYIVELF